MNWRHDSFIYAHPRSGTPTRAEGRVHPRGIGLFEHDVGNWTIVHINTGLTVCYAVGVSSFDALEIATEISECGDWDFHSAKGWENMDPALIDNVAEIAAHWGESISFGDNLQADQMTVQAVNAARAN